MQISSRFTIAMHTLMCIYTFNKEQKITSDFIASSVNVNPVIIRRILGSLKDAGIIEVARGSGGAKIIKDYATFTLLDIFQAVDSLEEKLFGFHENPNPKCPVGRNVHNVLDGYLTSAQAALESELSKTTFKDITENLGKLI